LQTKILDIEMHNTKMLSIIPRWKGTISIPSTMGEGAKGVTIELPAAMVKFWRSLDETLDQLRKRDTKLKQGSSQAQVVLTELKKEQARLVQMQQNLYEVHQKGTEEFQTYLQANYQQFQIMGTDFGLNLYNQIAEVSKRDNNKVQEALQQAQQWLVTKVDMFS
jgi:hypothetical protein